ncbi:MAG: nucleotide exchange factor GrpE [Candidatus Thermoplasmatota archaeon]|nr:nucleotide exchange factor GrpE [Candidatus Thermoplasmatota archaeon]
MTSSEQPKKETLDASSELSAPKKQESLPTMDEVIAKISKETEALGSALRREQDKSKEYFERIMRLQADFENYQKHTRKEMEIIAKLANERLMLKILDTRDDIQRALNIAKKAMESKPAESKDKEKTKEEKEQEHKAKVLIEGFEMTLKNIDRLMKEEGIEPIECIGMVADTTKHEVVAVVPTPNCKDCVVLEELRKGYMMNGHVIRTSLVKVTKNSKK